jgi:hypothetical protein
MPPPSDPVTERLHGPDGPTADGLAALLADAAAARTARAEVAAGPDAADSDAEGSSAVCAWNHFENIPTFYNWNNRPR